MNDPELNKIEKQIHSLGMEQGPLKNLIKRIDDIYIILAEKNHINLFDDKLSSIKSNLATVSTEQDTIKRQEVFNHSKQEVLDLLKEISALT